MSHDMGRRMENFIFMHLRRKAFVENSTLFYHKTRNGRKVDFVLKGKMGIESLIQICYDITNIKTREREVTALVEASEELRCRKRIIITWDYEKHDKDIAFIPLWKYIYM